MRSRVTDVRLQRRHARRQLRLARRYAAGRAELHLRSGFRHRHACRNGRIASASTSLTRRNFAWRSLASGNFALVSYTGGIIPFTSAYTCFCSTKSNSRTRQSRYSGSHARRYAQPSRKHVACACRYTLQGRPQQQQSNFGGAF